MSDSDDAAAATGSDAASINPLAAAALQAIEATVNRGLAGDPVGRDRLAALAGRLVRVAGPTLPGLGAVAIDIGFSPAGIVLTPAQASRSPDLWLQATPGAWLELLRTRRPPPAVRTEGDGELMLELASIMRELDIDLLALLPDPVALGASYVGQQLQGFARALAPQWQPLWQQTRSRGEAARDTVRDTVRSGLDLPEGTRGRARYREIEDLRDAIARAEARLTRLESAQGPGQPIE